MKNITLFVIAIFFIISIIGTESYGQNVRAANSNSIDFNIFDLPKNESKITWFGVDCSLYKLQSDLNLAQDEKLRVVLINAIEFHKNSHMSAKQLRGWLNVKEIDDKYLFGIEQIENNLPKIWILNEEEMYHITRAQIREHIKTLKVSGQGIGIIEIPETTDMLKRRHFGWVVFFDVETKEVVWMDRFKSNQHLNESPKLGHFATEWAMIMKEFIDKVYKKNI